ncbi:MAG: hypothetical protein IJQ31_16165 [Thermoguttaceae bacterium]|nr:hypothetical protein [Thermoguttaceae bacterium]
MRRLGISLFVCLVIAMTLVPARNFTCLLKYILPYVEDIAVTEMVVSSITDHLEIAQWAVKNGRYTLAFDEVKIACLILKEYLAQIDTEKYFPSQSEKKEQEDEQEDGREVLALKGDLYGVGF